LKINKKDLVPHWLVYGLMLLSLVLYQAICHRYGHELRQVLPEAERVFIRTVFYVLAIISFPITNLIRHIQLRLNQTMPGNKPVNSRYLFTIITSGVLVESVGVYGFILFLLGDDFNTLNIFSGLALLGLYLYRPKWDEYVSIAEALNEYSS
jgi:preprotein translocase subunit Sss1